MGDRLSVRMSNINKSPTIIYRHRYSGIPRFFDVIRIVDFSKIASKKDNKLSYVRQSLHCCIITIRNVSFNNSACYYRTSNSAPILFSTTHKHDDITKMMYQKHEHAWSLFS